MDTRQRQFEALVNAYSADLYRYAVWLVRNGTVAEDLVQETFMRAWKSLDSLRDPNAAKSWLITILRRERARLYEKRRPENDSIDDLDLDGLAGLDGAHGKTEVVALRRALAALPEDYREPLLMQVIGGYSCEEIAEFMGVQRGAIMTRLFRARQKLRRYLEGDEARSAHGAGL